MTCVNKQLVNLSLKPTLSTKTGHMPQREILARAGHYQEFENRGFHFHSQMGAARTQHGWETQKSPCCSHVTFVKVLTQTSETRHSTEFL